MFAGLDASVLRSLIVYGSSWVKERHVAVFPGAEVNFFQLQFISRVEVLLRIPHHPAIQDLT